VEKLAVTPTAKPYGIYVYIRHVKPRDSHVGSKNTQPHHNLLYHCILWSLLLTFAIWQTCNNGSLIAFETCSSFAKFSYFEQRLEKFLAEIYRHFLW